MRRALLISIATAFSTPAFGAGGCFGAGQALFHCSFKSGQQEVHLCLQNGVVTYAYGPRGQPPDLLLARPVRQVFMQPWAGFGRSLWEDFAITNGAHAYVLHHSLDRMDLNARPEGDLVVVKGEQTLAELTCDPGSVSVADFYPLYEAKEAAGQCWDRAEENWRDC